MAVVKLTFSITAGNTGNAFAINSSGQITVADASKLDFESSTKSYSLTVQVNDGVTTTANAALSVLSMPPRTTGLVGAREPTAVAASVWIN